uniref:Uncharacterized protein n=1 Tax=Nothobranchius furzeri TaxID=105023 RepID=A0A8C6P8G2_NOTFU
MCTTMMVLTTIALILRQRFSNKIQPTLCYSSLAVDRRTNWKRKCRT